MTMVDHLILTFFGVRGLFPSRCENPLDPRRLEHRLRLLEAIVSPSLASQTCQAFRWLVIVDPELPPVFRSRLESLLKHRPGNRVVEPVPGRTMGNLDWLEDHIDPAASHVLTTLLDDDDALSSDLVGYLQDHVYHSREAGALPPLKFFGCEQAMQWDFCEFPDAPLGHAKPWTRRDPLGRRFPVSAGFSLCVEYPRLNLSVRGFGHHLAANACSDDDDLPARLPRFGEQVQGFRTRVRTVLGSAGPEGARWSLGSLYHACGLPEPQALMVNHLDNLQHGRVREGAARSRPVSGPETFPGVVIDWELAERYIRDIPAPVTSRSPTP